ncbi:MAG: hypothetical protein IPN79_03615 [Saprospiraceae bacterium]|nr:hypothetical protein [Saprospiraceae bacterium]
MANSPHPDIAALKQLIEQNKNYEAEVVFAGENITNIGKFDLAILPQSAVRQKYYQSRIKCFTVKKDSFVFYRWHADLTASI